MKPTLKELVRRKAALINGIARPGRVTQLAPDGKGGFLHRAISPDTFRRQQAGRHAVDVAAARARLGLSQREIAVLLGVLLRLAQKDPQAVLAAATA